MLIYVLAFFGTSFLQVLSSDGEILPWVPEVCIGRFPVSVNVSISAGKSRSGPRETSGTQGREIWTCGRHLSKQFSPGVEHLLSKEPRERNTDKFTFNMYSYHIICPCSFSISL